MARTSQPGTPGPEGFDLDALIGDLQGEAARRRAESGFPLDDEARLGLELDQQAPRPLAPKLERLADLAIRARSRQTVPSRTRRGWRLGPAGSGQPVSTDDADAEQAPSLSEVVAQALRTVSNRLADLEARLRRVENQGDPPAADLRGPTPSATSDAPAAGFATWKERLTEHLVIPPGGRVVCFGVDAEEAVGILRAGGVDAYGLVPDGDRYRTHPDVRQGDLRSHLTSLSDSALGAAVLVEPWVREPVATVRTLLPELARVTPMLVIVSVAPWWWRARLGPAEADLAAERPLAAETWLALLDRAGFVSSAEYDESGATYRVVARRSR
jgi:hypothetical protein